MGAAVSSEDVAAVDASPPPVEDNYALLDTPACAEATQALDVQRFLGLLAKLAQHRDALASARLPNELPNEAQIAVELFNWDKSFHVSRAPGRLDVMGGIADYSGAHVLQMPTAEACLVAVQVQPESRSVRVLSFGATAGGRAPLFEIALDELRSADGQPRPLGELRERLARDASTAWAAYVVGTLAVLMHEEDVCFDAGMSFIVSSDVPEGKGVSSSAAVEVSSMMALMAAHGVMVAAPERLAVLCQMVENLVVGAPCGIMDQMASTLGRRGQLLSLLCRPARMQPALAIPPGVRFWGVDSGVRHSVGGSDYGSVRCAAFMGRAILRWVQRERGESQLEHLTALSPSQARWLRDGCEMRARTSGRAGLGFPGILSGRLRASLSLPQPPSVWLSGGRAHTTALSPRSPRHVCPPYLPLAVRGT